MNVTLLCDNSFASEAHLGKPSRKFCAEMTQTSPYELPPMRLP